MKQRRLTWEQLLKYEPCNIKARKLLFDGRESLTVRQAFCKGADLKDMLWVAAHLGLRQQICDFARECVVHVEHWDNCYVRLAKERLYQAIVSERIALVYVKTCRIVDLTQEAVYAGHAGQLQEHDWQIECFIRIFEFESEESNEN